MKRLALLTFTLITAIGGSAMADDAADEAKSKALAKIAEYDNNVIEFIKQDGLDGAYRFDADPAGCTAAIAAAEKLGVAKTETVYSQENFPFRKAAEHCERYAKLKTLSEAFPAISKARDGGRIINGMKPGDAGTTMWTEEGAIRGKACVAAINDAEAKGAIMDLVIHSTQPEMTAADTRTWCEDLIKRAAALNGESASADAAIAKKARERYTKFGAAGDKLEWLLTYDPSGKGHNWYVAGCKTSDDPKTLVKAKLLAQLWEMDDGGLRVRKLTFKGNKKVNDQERTYGPNEKSKAYAWCGK
jgi:hypothetical protein